MTHFLLTFSTSWPGTADSFQFFQFAKRRGAKNNLSSTFSYFNPFPFTTFPFQFLFPQLHSPSLLIPLHYIPLLFQFPSTTFIFPFNSPPLHSSFLSIPLHYIHLPFYLIRFLAILFVL